MRTRAASLSVLVVDENPEVLIFLAKVLGAAGIRALLARNGHEALGIAQRGYVPIDLILSNSAIPDMDSAELVTQAREIRPGVRSLFMSAFVDQGVIRIEPLGATEEGSRMGDHGLLEAVRKAATAPLARHGGTAQG